MSIGTYKTTFPRGRFPRGWNPQNPVKQTLALPVQKEPNTDGREITQFIWPGHVITPTADGTKWQRGVPAGSTPGYVAIAQDSSWKDYDAIEVNKLVGLSCSDSFRFATPFFARMSGANTGNQIPAYTVGTRVTYCTNDETETRADGTVINLSGYIRPAKAGEPVIGVVAEQGSGINSSIALQPNWETAIDSESIPENAYFVVFDTSFAPEQN